MIIKSRSLGFGEGVGVGMTSQLVSFPSKGMADRVAKQVEDDAKKSVYHTEVIKLYLKDGT